MSDETPSVAPGFRPLRETHGKYAQGMSAVILGAYGFYGGLIAGQIVCGFIGIGG